MYFRHVSVLPAGMCVHQVPTVPAEVSRGHWVPWIGVTVRHVCAGTDSKSFSVKARTLLNQLSGPTSRLVSSATSQL